MLKGKKIKLPKKNRLTKLMVEELDTLFLFSQPSALKTCLMEVFLDYCLKDESLNFKENTEAFFELHRFLSVCEKEIQKKLIK